MIDEDAEAKQTMLSELDRFILDSQLSRHMQEVIGKYIMMEEYFMRETVLKVRGKVDTIVSFFLM